MNDRHPIYITCLLLAALLLGGSSCGGGEHDDTVVGDTAAVLVQKIRQQNRLYSTEYKVRKIVTHEDVVSLRGSLFGKQFSIAMPFGKRKIAIPIDATLKGSIDFSQFSAGNVRRQGGKIEILLPDPEIILISTRVDYATLRQHVALLRSNFTDEELTHYAQMGRESMLRDITVTDIVERARVSAAHILVPMLVQLGYKEQDITITYRTDLDAKALKPLTSSPQPGR